MIGKKINQLATELAPVSTDLTIIGDPTTGVSKKITLAQLGAIFSGAVSFYTNLAGFPAVGDINVIYCAKDTQKLYLWSGSAYVEVFPSQALLDTYQLRSEKGNANGYASLDNQGKVPISQLPSSIMEYKGTWNASTNTPTLANGTGDTGDVYICNVAGTVNFGAGPLTFAVGDYVIYSGTIWQRSSGAVGTVTSVAVSRSGDALAITGSPVTTSGTINIGFAGTSGEYINGAGNRTTFPTLLSSVGLSMPSAFNVANSPLTANGTIAVTGAGNATQYVRGDGQLATLPTNGGGGGASVSYYLNGSINQGTIGGVTYYEMNKTPIIGAGTDFTRSSNGYIASFLTDANDPALLNIPAGNFNFETYFEASSGGGSPTFYIELYKYDGTTFTLIASNSTSPKLINDGTNIEAYFSALAVPQTTLTLTDRLAIRIYVTTAGRTITLHTENGHLCQVITTFTTGLTALNGLTAQVQYFATGTSGTDFNISSATATHTFNLPTASATNRGALASADWTTFNNKQNALNGTGFVKISGTTISYDNSTYYLASNPNAYIALTALSAGAGISYNNTTGVIASTITQYTDANARAAISLTTSGTSGAATYNSTTGVLNVPQYAPDLSGYVPTSRTLTINGTAYDLSANRSWSVGTVTSVGLSSATSGVTIGSTPITTSGTITLAIATASGSQQGLLSSTDWTTFNNKQNALTNPVTGTGTTNYLPKFTGTSTIGNSNVFDNGTSVGIGTASPTTKLTVSGGYANFTDGTVNIYLGSDGTGGLFGTITNQYLRFITNDIERMRIDASGNLGLAVTPENSAGTWRNFQFGGGNIVFRNGLVNGAFFGTGYIFKTNNSEVYSTNSAVSRIYFDDNTIRFQQAPSGTAGNAISFTQAMTLGSNSGLSIGTTTAASANGLRVAGDSTFSSNIIFANTNTSINYGSSRFFLYNGTNTYVGDIDGLSSTASLILRTNGIDRLTILASTGAATFSSSVKVNSGTDAIDIGTATGNSYRSNLILRGTNASGVSSIAYFGINVFSTDGSVDLVSDNNLIFRANGSTERMRILANGNVGIGTSSPSDKLHVVGGGIITGDFYNSSATGNHFISAAAANVNYPTYGFYGDTGLGMYRPTTDALGFVTNDTERMRILANGNVGIGTTSPVVALDLGSSTDKAFHLYSSAGDYYGINMTQYDSVTYSTNIFSGNGGTIKFRTASGTSTQSTRMTISATGNVGIGTTSPSRALHVLSGGGTAQIQSTGTTSHMYFADANSSVIDNQGFGSVGNNLWFSAGGFERMRITSGGEVGIGTSTMSSGIPLSISAGSGLNTNIAFQQAGTNKWFIRNLDGTDDFSFYSVVNSAERMRITSGGAVLIGTTTEGFLGKLQVSGTVAITGQYNTVLPSSSFSYFDGSGQVVSSSSNASALYLDTTWNTTGNPDGIYLNVTNTASGASSKLLNLKVGSVSQFSVSKAGAIQTTAPSSGSAQPWKLGSYAAGGTGTATGVIYIEINGQIYSIPALQGTP